MIISLRKKEIFVIILKSTKSYINLNDIILIYIDIFRFFQDFRQFEKNYF